MKTHKSKLSLSRETVKQLSDADVGRAAGGRAKYTFVSNCPQCSGAYCTTTSICPTALCTLAC
jgi:hypothetical protein